MAPHNVAAPNMLPASELMLPTAYTKQVTRNTNNVYNLKIDCLSTKYWQGQTNTKTDSWEIDSWEKKHQNRFMGNRFN